MPICSSLLPAGEYVVLLLFVIAENYKIVKIPVFVIYLPKSHGCCILFDVAIGSPHTSLCKSPLR